MKKFFFSNRKKFITFRWKFKSCVAVNFMKFFFEKIKKSEQSFSLFVLAISSTASLPQSKIALWHLGRKANLLNWLLLLFRCSDFYIRSSAIVKDGRNEKRFLYERHVHGRWIYDVLLRGWIWSQLILFEGGGFKVFEVFSSLCGYVKCVWLIKGYCQLLKLKISVHPKPPFSWILNEGVVARESHKNYCKD